MEKFSSAVNAITNLHVHIKCPITKQRIIHVCKLIELMKMIKLTMEKYATEIYHTTLCLSQHQIFQALKIISNVKVNEQHFDAEISNCIFVFQMYESLL